MRLDDRDGRGNRDRLRQFESGFGEQRPELLGRALLAVLQHQHVHVEPVGSRRRTGRQDRVEHEQAAVVADRLADRAEDFLVWFIAARI